MAPTSENLNVLVSPKVDAFRLPNIWDTDIRFARAFAIPSGRMPVTVRIVGDVFNLFNANTGLTRVNLISNAASGAQSATFNTLVSNMSPRIARIGVVVGF